MKYISLLLVFAVLFNSRSSAQTQARRNVRLHSLVNDSFSIPFNEQYYLIEDSCASIIRYARYNPRERKFSGPFKDVSKSNPQLVLCEGAYSNDGLKEGDFTSRYLNGNLQAKGNFKANKFNGPWEIFYEDGKPKVTFEGTGNDIKITEAWDEGGKKTVDNGKGNYVSNTGMIEWSGKLVNGHPDEKWKARNVNDRTNTIVSENFKNGQFRKGSGPAGDYSDASRVVLITEEELPFTNAEKMFVSSVPCNGVKRKQVVNAQYREGPAAFAEEIKMLVRPFLSTVDLKPYEDELTLEGEVSEQGRLSLTYRGTFNDKIASGLARELQKLPSLEPALVDGKPVKQKFTITFKFSQGFYSFVYRFLPVDK